MKLSDLKGGIITRADVTPVHNFHRRLVMGHSRIQQGPEHCTHCFNNAPLLNSGLPAVCTFHEGTRWFSMSDNSSAVPQKPSHLSTSKPLAHVPGVWCGQTNFNKKRLALLTFWRLPSALLGFYPPPPLFLRTFSLFFQKMSSCKKKLLFLSGAIVRLKAGCCTTLQPEPHSLLVLSVWDFWKGNAKDMK